MASTVKLTSSHLKKVFPFILFIIACVAVGLAVYFYIQYRASVAFQKKEADSVIVQVGKLMVLPQETPTLATVTDTTKLSAQPFFQNAKTGDKVLIYSKTKRAILYRPSVNKIIEIGSLSFQADSSSSEISNIEHPTSNENPPRILILNGTTTPGLATLMEDKLKKANISIAGITVDNAKKNNYQKNVIYDYSGSYMLQTNEIAKQLQLSVLSSSPEGELFPKNIDIVVIVGK